jgi:GNAT superfamily N-acetyltransferase
LSSGIVIRPFAANHALEVRELFISVNRLLSPPHLREAFETYIHRSLTEEMDRIIDYYAERNGGFWVALGGSRTVGMFGLERTAPDAMELRRMYVDPSMRRSGIARTMLGYAEAECRRRRIPKIELSTSELQIAALALYRDAGYTLIRQEAAEESNNKTIGGGIRRFYFEKAL